MFEDENSEFTVNIARLDSDITMLKTYLDEKDISTLLGALEGLKQEPESEEAHPVAIRGTEGFMVSYAKCCHPIPGDPIEGYLSSEKGVVVHRERCNNLNDMRENSDRLVALRSPSPAGCWPQ